MTEIAEIMGAVTNCAVAGIQAGRDIGKAERDRLQSQLDEAVALLRTAEMFVTGDMKLMCRVGESDRECLDRTRTEFISLYHTFLATLAREDAA
jgi:hypothetical protein